MKCSIQVVRLPHRLTCSAIVAKWAPPTFLVVFVPRGPGNQDPRERIRTSLQPGDLMDSWKGGRGVPPLRAWGQALVDCARKKSILCFQQCSYFLEIMPKLCYFLKIMLSVTEIMLLRFYTDFKENKDHQQLNSINFDFNEHSYSPPSGLTVFSIANTYTNAYTHVRTSKSQMINK